MAVRALRKLGDPVLRGKAAPVDPLAASTRAVADDLFDTLRATRAATSYGRAIAAPQIGEPVRVVVANLERRWDLVNPEITRASEERLEWWDACLSFLDTFGRLERHATITLRWWDLEGAEHEEAFEGDMAELFQHELDHLDGVLAVDRFTAADTQCTRLEFERRHRADSPYADAKGTGPDPLRISLASLEIDPAFLRTPQVVNDALCEEAGTTVVAKIETLTPIRSFKGRGADWLLRTAETADGPIICASAGNFGQGIAYAARGRGRACTVFAPETANALKVERMRALGADVRLHGSDFDAAKDAARAYARDHGGWFVEDGREPAIAEGAGTIGSELGAHPALVDAVVVPVGNGALINGIGTWVKAFASHTEVIGVCAAGAPSMLESWRTGEPRPTPGADTIADGIAVREPVPEALETMRAVVDDMLLVDDEQMLAATRAAHRHLGLVVEPAGAAGLAALLADRDRFAGRTVATPLCGGNVTREQIARWLG